MENEFVNQVKDDLKDYAKTLSVVGRLRLVGGISRVLGFFLMVFTVILLAFAVISFCAVAAISALSYCMPVWAASLVVGGVYVVLIALAIIYRKPLFINPFVSRLSAMFFSEEGRQIEEERLREEAMND